MFEFSPFSSSMGGFPGWYNPNDAYVYGVKWNTANSSPTLTKGIVVNGQWIDQNYTVYPIQDLMKRCVLTPGGLPTYYLDGSDSINKSGVTPTISGTSTSVSSGKLVDSSGTFVSSGVTAGQWIKNVSANTRAMIVSVDSETQLTLHKDIFSAIDQAYQVGTANPKADGAVYVDTAAFNYVWTEDGTDTYILISQSPFAFKKPSDGTIVSSILHPWFSEGGTQQTHKYFSAFESVWYSSAASSYVNHDGVTICVSGDKAVSLPGYKPLSNQYRQSAISYQGFVGLHSAFGASHHSLGFYGYEAIWILMVTEWGSLDGQTKLPGYTDASEWSYNYTRNTGRTMKLGNASGSIVVDLSGEDSVLSGRLAAGKYVANSFHGIENPFGHIWKWLTGFNVNWTTAGRVYLSNIPAQWAEATPTNYTDTGCDMPTSNGYISELFPGRLIPKTVSGGSSTYLRDYFYQPGASAGWRGLIIGGHLNYGAYAGPAHLRADNSGSGNRYAYVGGRAAA